MDDITNGGADDTRSLIKSNEVKPHKHGTYNSVCSIDPSSCKNVNNTGDRCSKEEEKPPPKSELCPLIMITIAVTFVVGADSSNSVIVNQFVYNVFAKQLLGNITTDIMRNPCGNQTGDDFEKIEEVKQKTSDLYLHLTMTSYGIGILCTVFLGTYSHLLHRRALILIPTLGLTARCTVFLVVAAMDLDIMWLFLGFGIDGLCGTLLGVLMGVFLYSTDITPRNKKRTFAIALLDGVKGLMAGVVQVATGFLLNKDDFILPSSGVVGLLVIALVIMCGLPNRKPVLRLPASDNNNNNKWSIVKSLRIMISPFMSENKLVGSMVFLGMANFFTFIVINLGVERIYTLYFMGFPFCWSALTIGWYGFEMHVSRHLFIICGIPLLYRHLPGLTTAIIGIVFLMASDILLAFAETTWQGFLGPILAMGLALPITLVRGETSRLLGPEYQGPLFACFAVLESFSFFLGPTVFLSLYRVSLHVYRGLPYLIGCGANLLPLVTYILHQKKLSAYTKETETKTESNDESLQKQVKRIN